MNYELMVIKKPDVGAKEEKDLADKLRKIIAGAKGAIAKEEEWGRRALSYPIGQFSEGIYHLLFFDIPAAKLTALEKALSFDEVVLRYLIIGR